MTMTEQDINRIRYLSQELGLFDDEIAEQMDVHRVTVNRVRIKHNIPRPNLSNRVDKKQVCKRCGQVDLIPRHVRRRNLCVLCKSDSLQELQQKKRDYMRDYNKIKKHSAGMLQNGS